MLKSTGLVRDFHKSLVRGEEREPGAGRRPRITWQGCLWGRAERLPTCVPASRDPHSLRGGRGEPRPGCPSHPSPGAGGSFGHHLVWSCSPTHCWRDEAWRGSGSLSSACLLPASSSRPLDSVARPPVLPGLPAHRLWLPPLSLSQLRA